MPDETQRDRDLRALDAAQKLPCGLCIGAPRGRGDHLCLRCRARLKAARDDYEAKAQRLDDDDEARRDEAAERKGDAVREGDRERGPGGRPRCP
jgi:hypothetical protein